MISRAMAYLLGCDSLNLRSCDRAARAICCPCSSPLPNRRGAASTAAPVTLTVCPLLLKGLFLLEPGKVDCHLMRDGRFHDVLRVFQGCVTTRHKHRHIQTTS